MGPASGTVRQWSSPRRLVVGIVGAAMLVALGVHLGLRSPWGVKHPQVAHGTAMRANDENDLVMFDADDGTQIDFGADRIWWESGSRGGEGNPPCLTKPHDKVRVDVGFVDIAGPEGGSRVQAVWVKCP